MPPVHPAQPHPPSGTGRSGQQGGRHNAVPHDGILPAGQRPAPLHGDGGAARPPDAGPQAVEEALKVADLRLPGGVGNGGGAGRPPGAQHGGLRGPHAGQGQMHLAPRRPPMAVNAPLLAHLTPQGADGGQVQVNGPGAQLTPAGICKVGLPHPGQQRPQKYDGRAHGAHLLLRHGAAGRPGRVHRDGVPFLLRPAPQAAQDIQRRRNVGELRAVAQHHRPSCQQAGGQNGQHAVFRPVNSQLPLQRRPAPKIHHTHGKASP